MGQSDFESAPNMYLEFRSVDGRVTPPSRHQVDATNWELTDEPELPKIAEQHPTLDLTPGGYLEQDVHTQLDDRARSALRAATQQRLESRDDLRDGNDQWEATAARMNDRWNGRANGQLRQARTWEEVLDAREAEQSQEHEREIDFSDDRDR